MEFYAGQLYPETTIFLGNGFDLSLGLRTRYIDFFDHTDSDGKKDFWPIHNEVNNDERLYKCLNGLMPGLKLNIKHKTPDSNYTWYDLENELKQHAKRESNHGDLNSILHYSKICEYDCQYYKEVIDGLLKYLKAEIIRWEKYDYKKGKQSPAYEMMKLVCAKTEPNIITFNYTDVNHLIKQCEGNSHDQILLPSGKIQHIHGSLSIDHIILGVDEDKEICKEYDFLFKSWDDYYAPHKVIETLKRSRIILFFGLSFGAIDSVYFVDFFKSINRGTYDKQRKLILIFTYDEDSLREIQRQFKLMGLSITHLKSHCEFQFVITNPKKTNQPQKFEASKLRMWLNEWGTSMLDL